MKEDLAQPFLEESKGKKENVMQQTIFRQQYGKFPKGSGVLIW